MDQIKDIMRFTGKWRSYQKRVLDHSDKYLIDKRIHIVAAPGSGKTTLGIELIRRLNAPCLILAPSVNIRDQWLGRIREAFLEEGKEPEGFLSNKVRNPGILTAITYQALHRGMTRDEGSKEKVIGDERETDEKVEEFLEPSNVAESGEEDYSDFDFFATVRKAGIKTICLDEAHHLRSEWWKALEDMISKMQGITLISLTATPPYDSTPQQWERYIGLCGPIDEEIIVPELVKEGSLCPHQDYVYFNMPTEDEKKAVEKFKEDAFKEADELFRDEKFTNIITTHAGLSDPESCTDLFIEKPEYLEALLVFLQAKNIVFQRKLTEMLGTGTRLPQMTTKWMEILLQGFLYDDCAHYVVPEGYIEKLKGTMKSLGLVQRNKIVLCDNDAINKLLMNSKGKMNSILKVTKSEYENLGSDLRLLILTDYIKKEYLSYIGDESKGMNELGVIPIFENIRRAFSGERRKENTSSDGSRITAGDLRIGVLSGSVVLIPARALNAFQEILDRYETKANIRELSDIGFCQIQVVGSEMTASRLITELFNRGEVRVLIGTKSLLGEGWDSPCINSLILASFVGSFMLSNQMRGRAIRVMKGNPNKVSNIWHLICMQPEEKKRTENVSLRKEQRIGNVILEDEKETLDFTTLKRRFEGFLGVCYERDVIENGLRRLSYIKGPYTEITLQQINEQMLTLAANREGLKKRWEDSLKDLHQMELVVEAGADNAFFKAGGTFYLTLGITIFWGILFILSLYLLIPAFGSFMRGSKVILDGFKTLMYLTASCVTGVFLGTSFSSMYKISNPLRYMKTIGNCVKEALYKFGTIQVKGTSVDVEEDSLDGMSYIFMRGGSERDKDVFAKCVCEFFGMVENQRYLLIAKKNVPKLCKYYCVPELFGKKKEDSMMFHKKVHKYIGDYRLVYTKNGSGREELLAAKMFSLANKNPECIRKRKTVKNAL